MKELFTAPEAEIIIFTDDIVTASPTEDGNEDTDTGAGGGIVLPDDPIEDL